MEKKYLILIVDDHTENRTLLRKITESNGYKVIEAENGQTALESARLEIPDLIISDILMPVMDGYKFCMEVKNDEKLKNIPFIFYTATYTEKKDEEFALSLGAVKFLIKPMEPEVLIKIIENYLKEFEKGKFTDPVNIVKDEKETFKLYSERLVNKLEKKTIELENEITQRRNNDEELKVQKEKIEKSEKVLKSYIENAPDGIFIADENGFYVDVNNSACKQLGYSKNELLKMHLSMTVPEGMSDIARESFANIQKTGKDDRDVQYQKKSGEIGWWRLSAVKLSETRFMGFTKDITKEKLVQEELEKYRNNLEKMVQERTKELEQKNAELVRFNKVFVEREFRIKELKDRIKELELKLKETGKEPK